ncbi:MAG: hypothetical protein V4724_41070 [Pseudomonadota bacterium]
MDRKYTVHDKEVAMVGGGVLAQGMAMMRWAVRLEMRVDALEQARGAA